MGDTLSEEEVQIISYYLDLTASEEEFGGESEENWEFAQHTQLMVFVSFKFVIFYTLLILQQLFPQTKKCIVLCISFTSFVIAVWQRL